MKTLCAAIHFLDGRFHGRDDYGAEWPPSPFRLFQAMLAASSRSGSAEDEAFQWLERLEPPDILAPEIREAPSWKTYVPNNDSDEKYNRQDRLGEKIFRPLRILDNKPLFYLWRIKPDEQDMASKLIPVIRRVCALGWGIDLVAADGNILSQEKAESLISSYGGRHWRPVPRASRRFRCPKPGSLFDLRDAYRSFLNRFDGNIYLPPKKAGEFTETPYAKVGAVQREVAAFKLTPPDDDSETWKMFDQRATMEIAAWVRGYLCSAAVQTGFPGDSAIYVAGHVPSRYKQDETPPRFSYIPLPSIGHKRADGMIRRLIVAEPYGGDGRYAQWARRVLTNAVLTDKNGVPQARLRPLPERDAVLLQYLQESRTFRTVTPVILPGYDDMKYAKAQKLMEKALEQTGFRVGDLEEPIYMQKAPFRNGCYGPRSYSLPAYLKGKSAMHVELKWKTPIPGPLALGAGRHLGLGLFAPAVE